MSGTQPSSKSFGNWSAHGHCTVAQGLCARHPPEDAHARDGGGGVKPNGGELSEGVGGACGRLMLSNTATYQGLLDCNQIAEAEDFFCFFFVLRLTCAS